MGHYAAEMGECGTISSPAMTPEQEIAWRKDAFTRIAAVREIETAFGISIMCRDPRVTAYLAERNRRQPELNPLIEAVRSAAENIQAEALVAVFGPDHPRQGSKRRKPT